MIPSPFRETLRRRADRLAMVRREGSPVFTLTFGAIAATTGREYHEISNTFKSAKKYEPLDYVVITNRSGVTLDLEINGDPYDVVPANSRVTVRDQAIWSLALENPGAVSVATGDVSAIFQRAPLNADKAARGE